MSKKIEADLIIGQNFEQIGGSFDSKTTDQFDEFVYKGRYDSLAAELADEKVKYNGLFESYGKLDDINSRLNDEIADALFIIAELKKDLIHIQERSLQYQKSNGSTHMLAAQALQKIESYIKKEKLK